MENVMRRIARTGQAQKITRALMESLERRTLFAVTIVDPLTATMTDVDGDIVKISVTTGTLTLANFVTEATGQGDQLQLIDFSAGGFDGANLTFKVTRAGTGDGAVNVGYIDSTGHDLGTVTLPGDLGRINAGDVDATVAGIKSLTVRSVGEMDVDSQAAGGSLQSTINTLGTLTVSGNVNGAFIKVNGTLNTAKVGGSIIGKGIVISSGSIQADSIGTMTVGFDLIGAGGDNSGTIFSGGAFKSLTIGGSVIGGDGDNSGLVLVSGDLATLKINGDVRGGGGILSGTVEVNDKLNSATIGGSLIGASGTQSGNLMAITSMGTIKITGTVVGSSGTNSGQVVSAGNINSLTIGGSLLGGSADSAGMIQGNNISTLKITGNVIGGSGLDSGSIAPNGNLNALNIAGSLIGGSGTRSGYISPAGTLGTATIAGSIIGGTSTNAGSISMLNGINSIKVTGDVRGGTGNATGAIIAGEIKTVTIGGSLVGGLGDGTGLISADGNISTVNITRDVIGANISGADSIDRSGCIQSFQELGKVTIGGSVFSGVNSGAGNITANGTIRAGTHIVSLTVKGSLVGNATNTVNIIGKGQGNPSPTVDQAIGSVSIKGRVEFARILGGYDFNLAGVNAHAQIGAVSVGKDWIASSLVAGASVGGDFLFGTNDDGIIGNDLTSPISTIKSLTITGHIYGTPASVLNADHYGIVARKIISVKIAGAGVALNAAIDSDIVQLGTTGDVTLLEV
jgi:hypothetical protein